MWLLRRTHRLHSWKLVMRLQLRVLSGIVMKCSYTDGEISVHTSSSFGFFFSYCLSQKVTRSSFGGVYSWDQQKCDQRVFSCGSWHKTPPVLGCQRFVTQPTKLTEGMLLFGRDGLLGRKCAVLSVAPRKHGARTDIFLEQFNWKKCKSHGQNSCLN